MKRAAMEAEILAALDRALRSPTWRDPEGQRDVRDYIKEGFQYTGKHVTEASVREALSTLVKHAADEDLEWMLKEHRADSRAA